MYVHCNFVRAIANYNERKRRIKVTKNIIFQNIQNTNNYQTKGGKFTMNGYVVN